LFKIRGQAATSSQTVPTKMHPGRSLASKFGDVRSDIQSARRLIGEGPGWIDRLRQAMKDGTIPLPVGVFALSQLIQPENPDAI
jgi:hypothetical protein